MSVATKNPFAILDAEDSPSPAPAPAPKETAPTPPTVPARGSQKPRGGPAARGGKYYPRGGAKGGPRAESGALNQNGIEEPAAVEGQTRFQGEGRGRGRGRGGRGGARGAGGHGRPFDKHSQTGKVDTEKRVHQSWGGDDGPTELKDETAAVTDAAADSNWGVAATDAPADDPWGTPVAADAFAPTEPERERGEGRPRREREPREPEEEDNTLTLEQYLAQKQESTVIPKLEGVRKANEGADDNIWKDAVPIQKNEEEDAYFVGKSKSAPKARTKKDEKVFLEIDARFERPSRGGRGGRGGDRGDRGSRGGRGRGAPRGRANGNGHSAPAVNVDDEKAFPSLA